MIELIVASTLISLIVISLFIIFNKKLADSIVLFTGFGLGSTILFFIFSAPDVALTEAVVGTGISSIIFLVTLLQSEKVSLK